MWEHVVSLSNLLNAWREFKRGKIKKIKVLEFGFDLENNLFKLHADLVSDAYHPSSYQSFYVRDPKIRHIHKAPVLDRVLHQALFRGLYHFFDRHFIYDSYSCRFNKGVHRGVSRLESFVRKISGNYHSQSYALKCDVQKFFDNIDHAILLSLIEKVIGDSRVITLIRSVVESFAIIPGCGLPLGNVTSQLFANIYLNELDQFIKHEIKARYYLRYCDDFVIVHQSRDYLENLIWPISDFLKNKLNLSLHPDKIIIRKLHQGIDYLGYVARPHYRVLRTRTKRRILRRLDRDEITPANLTSYLGVLKHCRGHKIRQHLLRSLSFGSI
ncbi:MAG: reverse transcriptase domain-containing protein [Patescibacteria group bacterium]